MAHVTGTATNFKDAFDKLRNFFLNQSAFGATAQPWQELRFIDDNIETCDTNMTLATNQCIENILRLDPRFFYTTDVDPANATQFSNFVSGTSFIRWKMRTAKAITSLKIRCHNSGPGDYYALRGFRLQYSDDNTNWTTATTISGLTWSLLEVKTLSGWAATGTHLYWRILVDQGGTQVGLYINNLLAYSGTELVNSSSSEGIYKGPGLSGTDEIFVGIRSVRNPIKGWYLLQLSGFTAFNSTITAFYDQPGSIQIGSGGPCVPLWDQAMPFWITGNGRRVIFSFKVSTIYEGGYMGFYLPYTTPSQYPYPLAIGGSMSSGGGLASNYKYDYVDAKHSIFCMPGTSSNALTSNVDPSDSGTLMILEPTGTWRSFANRPDSGSRLSESILKSSPYGVIPHQCMHGTSSSGTQKPFYANVGGGFTLFSHILFRNFPTPKAFYGELDGSKQISGDGNSSENTGTFAGKDYIVFQNTYRTSKSEYWAMVKE